MLMERVVVKEGQSSVILLTIIDTVENVDTMDSTAKHFWGKGKSEEVGRFSIAGVLLEKYQPQLHQYRIDAVQILTSKTYRPSN